MFSSIVFRSAMDEVIEHLYVDRVFTHHTNSYWNSHSIETHLTLAIDAGVMPVILPSNQMCSRFNNRKLYQFIEEDRIFNYKHTTYDDLPGTWVRLLFDGRVYRLFNVNNEEYQFDMPNTAVGARTPTVRSALDELMDEGPIATEAQLSPRFYYNTILSNVDYAANEVAAARAVEALRVIQLQNRRPDQAVVQPFTLPNWPGTTSEGSR